MKKFFRQNGVILLVIALLLSILIGLGARFAKGNTDPLSNAVNTVTAPIRSGISAVVDWAEGVYTYIFHYSELEDQIDDLEKQISDLEEQALMGEEATRENQQLRQLLGLKERRRDFVFETARVTGRSTSNWESTLTLSKGSSSGLKVGDCVVTETGVLAGVISEVGKNWATVSTVINVDIEMGGIVNRTFSAGVLEGDFALMEEGKLKLSYLPSGAQLVSGDRVMTSGQGDVYPSGLPVGRVMGVFPDASGQSRYAVITPEAKLDSLIEVFVITDFDIVE